MPDWNQVVRDRIGVVRLSPQSREDVVAELASHMEDEYESALSEGITPEQAEARISGQVTDWRLLRHRLETSKEDFMTDRAKQVLIPGIVTFAVSALAQMAVFAAREMFYSLGIPTPSVYWVQGSNGLVICYPWLAMLPFFGALAAYWSRRAGGNARHRVLAAAFPAIMMGAFLGIMVILSPFIDRHVPYSTKLFLIGIFVLGWVIMPGAALTLGSLPFLGQAAEKPTSMAHAAHS